MADQARYIFRVSSWAGSKIQRLKLIKTTAKTVTFEDTYGTGKFVQQTERRESARHAIFDTWGEAHAWLLAKVESELNTARMHLHQKQSEYGNIKGMKEPIDD